jgi:hypothetical protein
LADGESTFVVSRSLACQSRITSAIPEPRSHKLFLSKPGTFLVLTHPLFSKDEFHWRICLLEYAHPDLCILGRHFPINPILGLRLGTGRSCQTRPCITIVMCHLMSLTYMTIRETAEDNSRVRWSVSDRRRASHNSNLPPATATWLPTVAAFKLCHVSFPSR